MVDGFKWDALPKWFLNDTLTKSSGINALTVLCSTAMPVDINSLVDVAPTGMLTTLAIPSFDFDDSAGNVAHPGALPSHSKILTSSWKREMWPLWVPYSQQHDIFNSRGNVALPGALHPPKKKI